MRRGEIEKMLAGQAVAFAACCICSEVGAVREDPDETSESGNDFCAACWTKVAKKREAMCRYRVVQARTRSYGYTVQDTTGRNSSFGGPGCTGGWYKLKRDAQHRVGALNGGN